MVATIDSGTKFNQYGLMINASAIFTTILSVRFVTLFLLFDQGN
jgi:hypothetical protein